MKKICAAIAVISMLLCSSNVVWADNSEESSAVEPIQARYTHTASAESNLKIKNKIAGCTSAANGESGTTKIEATQYLEKKTLWWWDVVDSWDYSVNGNNLMMTNHSENELDSGTYRLRTVFKIYIGNASEPAETVEVTSKEITI